MPKVVLAYDDHLTIAISTTRFIEVPIRFEDENYFICDLTEPHNSENFGSASKGYKNQSFEI